jgi:hypothetical protein
MNFANAVKNYNYNAKTRTDNGMKTFENTSNKVLDYFSKSGSSRNSDLSDLFMSALAEDENLAIRALLWTRDIRGGAGERAQFRRNLFELERVNPSLANRIMPKIPELGRWDDLFIYQDPINRQRAFALIGKALGEGNALCAKWMPRKGAVAAELRNYLGLTPKQYRKTLVSLTQVVETKMCAKDWDNINFSHVPSLAAARYQKAFNRNAPLTYAAYKRSLADPKDNSVKINASAVYPYDVVKSVYKGDEAVANEQWKALPDYLGDNKVFPIIDTSGSMRWAGLAGNMSAYDIAVSLGLYVAERNKSDFKDLAMVFAERAKLVELSGPLSTRLKQLPSIIDGSTNLHYAFNVLLDIAVRGNVAEEDMPDTLLILSDMQFNYCINFDDSAFEMISRKYEQRGYNLPKIVFWNLTSRREQAPVKFDTRGTALVSGFSPAIAKAVLSNDLENYTPYNVMVKTLMDSRYDY